jgi:hypothetical protein
MEEVTTFVGIDAYEKDAASRSCRTSGDRRAAASHNPSQGVVRAGSSAGPCHWRGTCRGGIEVPGWIPATSRYCSFSNIARALTLLGSSSTARA